MIFGNRRWNSADDDFMRDKYICLEADKSELVYLLARSTGALNIVEAGTSFGVSTIYLALAAGQNAAAKAPGSITPGQGAQVFATENEPTKAKRAKEHWKEAGEEVEPWITLLEGDLRETLPDQMKKIDQIDMLLLDSMLTPILRSPFHNDLLSQYSLDSNGSSCTKSSSTKAPYGCAYHCRQHCHGSQ